MSNVIPLNGITRLNLDPDQVLEQAIGKTNEVVIIGTDKHGELYFVSSFADGPNVLWMLEKAKAAILRIGGVE